MPIGVLIRKFCTHAFLACLAYGEDFIWREKTAGLKVNYVMPNCGANVNLSVNMLQHVKPFNLHKVNDGCGVGYSHVSRPGPLKESWLFPLCNQTL